MTIRLLYITKDPRVGLIAEQAGVDWIFVDLEYRGKCDRQAGRNTVISSHTIEDVVAMKNILSRSKLVVRINPIGYWSAGEIDAVIDAGADILMLPFFKTAIEVREFINLVGRRAKTCLLLETMDAVNSVEEIISIPGIDFVHVGLNDLHIERNTVFMFEFLADGSLDALAAKLRSMHIVFGFGGISKIGTLVPPAEQILAEHYRVGSTGVILSRSFSQPSQENQTKDFQKQFFDSVRAIRQAESEIQNWNNELFERNRLQVISGIAQVVKNIVGVR